MSPVENKVPKVRYSFANSLATRIEALAWLLAAHDEHNAGMSSMSEEFMVTQVEPVVTQLLGIHQKVEAIRSLQANVIEPKYKPGSSLKSHLRQVGSDEQQLSFDNLGVDDIPVEVSDLSDATASQVSLVPSELRSAAFSKGASRLKVQQHAVPKDVSLVLEGAGGVEEPAGKSISYMSDSESEAGHVQISSSYCDSAVDSSFLTASRRLEYEPFETLTIWQQQSKRRSSVYRVIASVTSTSSTSLGSIRGSARSVVMALNSQPQQGIRTFVIPPGSIVRTAWDLMALILVIWDCIRIPMEFLDLPNYLFFQVMAWIVRFFWTIDLGLNFITGYTNEHGLSEIRLDRIFKRYAHTWLAPDIFLVSIDWVDMAFEESRSEAGFVRLAKSARVTRSLRALRLVRMAKAMQFMTYSRFAMTSDKLTTVVDILKICVVLVLFVHLVACVWCGLGRGKDGSQNWIVDADMLDDEIISLYLVSCIWALAQFSGGTDFPLPRNVEERLFNTITLLVCFLAAAAMVSLLTRATTKLLLLSSGPSYQLRQLRNYLAQHHISMRLMQRIQKNAHFIAFEQQSEIAEETVEMLPHISAPLLAELAMEIRGPMLTVHPFFRAYSRFCLPGMRQLCDEATKTKSIASEDQLFMPGERQREPHMFFISIGTLTYRRRESKNSILPGEWIAEMALWTDWVHRGSLTAASHSQVISVSTTKLGDVFQKFDTSLQAAALYAAEFVSHLNTIDLEDLSDLDLNWDRDFTFEESNEEVFMVPR